MKQNLKFLSLTVFLFAMPFQSVQAQQTKSELEEYYLNAKEIPLISSNYVQAEVTAPGLKLESSNVGELDKVLKILNDNNIVADTLNLNTFLLLEDSNDKVGIINENFNTTLMQYSQYAVDINNERLLFVATFKQTSGGIFLEVKDPQGNIIFNKYL